MYFRSSSYYHQLLQYRCGLIISCFNPQHGNNFTISTVRKFDMLIIVLCDFVYIGTQSDYGQLIYKIHGSIFLPNFLLIYMCVLLKLFILKCILPVNIFLLFLAESIGFCKPMDSASKSCVLIRYYSSLAYTFRHNFSKSLKLLSQLYVK